MPIGDLYDQKERALADELFEKLYSGASLEPLPTSELAKDEDLVEWARTEHAAYEATEGFEELQKQCAGHAGKAAAAAEEIAKVVAEQREASQMSMSALQQSLDNSAPTAADQDAADGLSGVDVKGSGWGGKWQGQQAQDARAKKLASKLKDNERLKKIALLAGKFRRIALAKRRHKLRSQCDEIIDIEQGGDIQRLLPTELVKLASRKFKMLARRDLFERKSLQYKMETTEELGRGPLILCVDKSPSMEGDKDVWACAMALALMDVVHRERRTFILFGFNDEIPLRYVVNPGRPMPEDALSFPCSGGTDITNVLDLAMTAIERKTGAITARAEIVLVTDGASDASRASQIKKRAQARGVRIYGIGIGVKKKALRPWCDVTHTIGDTALDNLDDRTADVLLGD
jgi:uncharacterized protein with von Willebrand factor type A (vWA) domain